VGELDAVISTSALEMGIDIGGLDACILVGYPGSVMATWQRSGRAGRSGRESVTVLVPLPDALDQYLVDHPEALLERPCEALTVDPSNALVARGHLVCAAAEEPLDPANDAAYLGPFAARLAELEAEGKLRRAADGRWRARVGRPHRELDLRGAGRATLILEAGSGRLIGTVDGVRVLFECHPGAVYLHRGSQYLVRELDLGGRTVQAEPVRVDYFTAPQTAKETEILELLDELSVGPLRAGLGRLRVTERVVGFERKSLQGQETLDAFELDLPPVSFETVGLWWLAPTPVEEALKTSGRHFMGALHASEHAAISLVPLHAVCDRGDLGGISQPRHPQLPCGGVFVYDGHAGGVGISARVFRLLPELLARVAALLEACPCEVGCPSCIQSPKCGNGNRPLDKAGAKELLDLLLRSPSGSAWVPEAPAAVLVGSVDL
jgi:DEAD/DEAH box helicase domain-containing protein